MNERPKNTRPRPRLAARRDPGAGSGAGDAGDSLNAVQASIRTTLGVLGAVTLMALNPRTRPAVLQEKMGFHRLKTRLDLLLTFIEACEQGNEKDTTRET